VRLWRISRHRDLSGEGGLRASGRWHFHGHRIVYLAETPAGALLETCVHTSANDIPPSFTLLEIEAPEDVLIEVLAVEKLSRDWIDHPEISREAGTEWLQSLRSALLKVPSALVPATFNILLNPLHPEAAKMRIEGIYLYPFDPRIKE
jgi:RES domain-containing protein